MARTLGSSGDDVLVGWDLDPDALSGTFPRDFPDPWLGSRDLLDGRAGNDSLQGGLARDCLIGGSGRDTLEGGDGNDTLLPAGGSMLTIVENNLVDGGHGIDWVSYEDEVFEGVVLSLAGGLSYDVILNVENLRGGGGDDRLTGNGQRNRLEGMAGRDTLLGGDGSDTLVGGNEASLGDDLHGGRGRDSLEGGDGFDLLFGEAGRDTLLGGDGTDSMSGGGDNDLLVGGRGADTMDGGTGLDIFRYASPEDGGDVILGYRGAADQVEVLASGFGDLVAGVDLRASGRYAANAGGTATAADGVGQFVFDTATRTLSWDPDGTGAASAILLFRLDAGHGWSGTEITVI